MGCTDLAGKEIFWWTLPVIIGVSQPQTLRPRVDSGATRAASFLLSGSENAISGESQADKTVFGFFFFFLLLVRDTEVCDFFPLGRRHIMDFGAQISTRPKPCLFFFFSSSANIDYAPTKCQYNREKDRHHCSSLGTSYLWLGWGRAEISFK